MCEMSMARNNGLISAEKETCGIRPPYDVPTSSVGEKVRVRFVRGQPRTNGEEILPTALAKFG